MRENLGQVKGNFGLVKGRLESGGGNVGENIG